MQSEREKKKKMKIEIAAAWIEWCLRQDIGVSSKFADIERPIDIWRQ